VTGVLNKEQMLDEQGFSLMMRRELKAYTQRQVHRSSAEGQLDIHRDAVERFSMQP
jgi:hypothetical protein